METIREVWNFIVNDVWPHWPGIMFIVIISVVAQTLKTQVFTKSLARKNSVIFWFRRIFPLILLGLGAVAGVLWPGETSPGVAETSHKCLYFAGCSGIAMIGFNVFKQWVKKKYDVDVG